MTEKQARDFQECIDCLQEIAYMSPNPDSLLCDDRRGNEFEREFRKIVKKANATLESLGLN